MSAKRTSFFWLAEPLELRAGFTYRRMFGSDACYLEGKLVAVFSEGEEPWNGMLVPADRDKHDIIKEQFPTLVNHEILPKWLYISSLRDDFEELGKIIIELILEGDPRFGTIPKPKKGKRKKRIKRNLTDKESKSEKSGKRRTSKKDQNKPLADGRPPYLV